MKSLSFQWNFYWGIGLAVGKGSGEPGVFVYLPFVVVDVHRSRSRGIG